MQIKFLHQDQVFLSIEKDFSIITKRILECKELTKNFYIIQFLII